MKTIKRFELRVKREKLNANPVLGATLSAPELVAAITKMICDGTDNEVFLVFLLSCANKIIGYSQTAQGGVDSCPVDKREVFRTAVLNGAAAIIVAHNHPSGNAEPSQEDLMLTRELSKAGALLGINVLDHVIVAGVEHTSFNARGLMHE